MVLKLIGSAGSTCTKRVATVLKEKNVPFEMITINFATGEHKAPSYIANQPFGQVPYIDDDGFILYESRAIARYIENKYRDQGNSLSPDPSDIKATALFDQALSNEYSNFDPFTSKIVGERVFKKYRGLEANEATVAEYLERFEGKLDAFNVILGKQKFLAGDKITLADLFTLPYGSLLKAANVDILEDPKRPNVLRWWKEISARPSWEAVKDGNFGK